MTSHMLIFSSIRQAHLNQSTQGFLNLLIISLHGKFNYKKYFISTEKEILCQRI